MVKNIFSFLVIVLFFNFLLYLIPGDQIDFLMGSFSEEEKNLLRETLHLKKDFFLQFQNFTKSLLTLDFGISAIQQESILKLLFNHFKVNFFLALNLFCLIITTSTFFLWLFISYKKNLFVQKIRHFYFYFTTIPAFLLSPLVIYLFCYLWPIFPLGNNILLPSLTLNLTFSAYLTFMVLKDFEEEQNKDYFKFHQGVGIHGKNLFLLLLKNLSLRIVNILTLQFLSVLTGMAVVERVFDLPGLGLLLLEALNTRDLPLIQACLIFNLLLIYLCLGISHQIQKKLHPQFK